MANTSGTINNQQYDIISLIEMASRRCGKLPGSLSAEETLDSRNELQMMLNSLVNEGVPLWTVDKQIYGVNLNQNIVPLTPGTVDLQNVLYRFNNLPSGGLPTSSSGIAANAFDQNIFTACTQTAPNGNISYNFLTPTVIVTVGLLIHGTAILNPVFEYSQDGITWVTSVPTALQPSSFVAGQWYWQDVASPQSALFYRVRETQGGTLDITEVVFGTSANEIILSRINKDDYQNLPFKNQQGRPLQFWFDRQITPQMWLWPASMYSFNSLVTWRRRQIQDVGAFQNIIEFPERWLDSIIFTLATRMIYIMPSADLSRAPMLEQKAVQAKQIAWTEERDASPLYYSPMIAGYTGYSGSNRGGY